MKYLMILLLLTFFFPFVPAQGEQISLRDFRLGMNSSASIFGLKEGEGLRCQNFNLSDKIGALTRRKGFVAITDSLTGGSSLVGIFGASKRDGSKRLYSIVDTSKENTDGVSDAGIFHGLGMLSMSPLFSYETDTDSGAIKLYDYIYTGVTPSWLMWKNSIIMSNGRQRPIVIYEDSARDLIPPAPGEPLVYPMNDDSIVWGWTPENGTVALTGNLLPNGEYRYAVTMTSQCGQSYGDEVVENGDFEAWTGDVPDDWTVSAGADNIYENDSFEVNGSSCVAMVDTSTGSYQTVSLKQRIDTLTVDTSYFIEAWIKRIDTSTTYPLGVAISVRDSASSSLLASLSASQSDTDMVYRSRLFTPISDTILINLYMTHSAPAGRIYRCYFDSVTVKKASTSVSYRESYVSQPIKVFNEKLLLKNFTFRTVDLNCDTNTTEYDNVDISIYRTKGYPGILNSLDTMFLVYQGFSLDSSEFDTLYFIDSIPDSFLGVYAPHDLVHIKDTNIIGYNSMTASKVYNRVGAPTYLGRNVAGAPFIFVDSTGDTLDYGFKRTGMVYTDYMMTLFDTLINAESDSSRVLRIVTDTLRTGAGADTARDTNYIIGVPPVPSGSSHYIRNLYRSMTYVALQDSTDLLPPDSIRDTVFCNQGDTRDFAELMRGRKAFVSQHKTYTSTAGISIPTGCYKIRYYSKGVGILGGQDTVTTAFFKIAELKDADVDSFVDTVTFDSAIHISEVFGFSNVTISLNGATKYDDRVWAFNGSDVYWSSKDSGSYWNESNSISLNADDGDEITVLMPARNYLRCYKNRSKFNVHYVGGDGIQYAVDWAVDGVGCIAPKSMVSYNDGLFYLSHLGVINETGSPYLAKASNTPIVSEPINDILLNRTGVKLRTAVGAAIGDEYRLSFPETDTTFVYNIVTGGWTIYSYTFTQTTLYDTLKSSNISPSNDMLFITHNSDRVFKADTTYADSGQAYYSYYQTRPIGFIPGMKYQVNKIAVWADYYNNVYGAILGEVRNMGDTATATFKMDRASDFQEYGVQGLQSKPSMYHTIIIRDTVTTTPTVITNAAETINGLDIWTSKSNEVRE